jgi:hypothetical protein
MKKLLVLVFIAALCMPSYGEVLVYKSTSSFNPWIDYDDANYYDEATAVVTKQLTGYLVLDVNLTTWKFNGDPIVIYYGKQGTNKWGEFFSITADEQWINAFTIQGRTASKGVLLQLGWEDDQEIVGSAWQELYGKISKVDIGKGAKNKVDVPSSVKGIVEEWDETDDIFEGLGNITASLDSKYTQYGNKGEGHNELDTVKYILAALKKQGYIFNEYILTVTVTGNGTVEKDPNQVIFHYEDEVDLTATADDGYSFISWGGCIDPNDANNPVTITMDSDKTITATFTQDDYTLDITVDGNGAVDKNPDQATYTYGDTVELTARGDSNDRWIFISWGGCIDPNDANNPVTITMDSDKTITATFTQDEYTLDVTVDGNGTVAKEPNKATYHYDDDVNLIATAQIGWTFDSWSGDVDGNDANSLITITMEGNKDITATFTQNAYTLTVTTDGNGTVTKNPNQATYHYADNVILTAIPHDSNYVFGSWGGDIDPNDANNPITITMDGDKDVTATFELD